MADYIVVSDDLSRNDVAELLAIPMLPLFYPPGVIVYATWQMFTHDGWHPLFRILGCTAESLAILSVFAVLMMCLPTIVSSIIFALYAAACYTVIFNDWGVDIVWTSAVAIMALVAGYLGGRHFSRNAKELSGRQKVKAAKQI